MADNKPQGTAVAPQGTAVAPQGTAVAPQGTAVAPQGTAVAPQGTAVAPQGTAVAPQGTAAAPQGTAVSSKTARTASSGHSYTLQPGIAYVNQESFLFKDTIASNICFSLDDVDKDLAKKYATLSDVDKDIEEFNEGYDTLVGERGVTVSGGQKQRISIARAFLKEAPILIMDDSLSAVDIITEEQILKQVRELRKDKTTILIAHRISTLKTLDKIIVLENGELNGIGTHESLLENNEIYKREVKLQELEKEEGEDNEN